MIVNFPTPGPGYDRSWMSLVLSTLTRSFARVGARDEGQPFVLLQSPNGQVWRVTVTDAGVLQVAAYTP